MLQVQLEIDADPAEVGRARRWARSRLADWAGGDEALTDTLLLLGSELVTNAVVHARTPSVLRMLLPVRRPPGAVRLEVADMSARPPRQRHADGEDTDGRGLELVSVLADRWGWQPEGLGKRIWCELDWQGPSCRESLSALPDSAHSAVPARRLTAGAVGGPDGVLPV